RLKGADVHGAAADGRTAWRSTGTRRPGGRYQVQARATCPAGKSTTPAGAFRTSRAVAATRVNNVVPSENESVGTGMPVLVQFNKAVPERAKPAIERSVEIGSTTPTEGAWRWLSAAESFNGLPSLVFRPKRPWKPRQTVSVTVHYAGLRIGDKVFGHRD